MLHTAATIGLAPVLLAQGRYVRRVTPILPEAAGPRSGTFGQGEPLRLLMTGDSSAAGVGVDTLDEGVLGAILRKLKPRFTTHWSLIAKSGWTTADTIQSLRQAPAEQVDVAVTALGVNDVTGMMRIPNWLEEQEELHDILRSKFGARHVIASGLPPMHNFPALPQPLRWFLGERAIRFDTALARWTRDQRDTTHVPLVYPKIATLMAHDGFHPSAEACTTWGIHVGHEIGKIFAARSESGPSL